MCMECNNREILFVISLLEIIIIRVLNKQLKLTILHSVTFVFWVFVCDYYILAKMNYVSYIVQ